MSRLEPDMAGYQKELRASISEVVASYPRTAAQKKMTMATAAYRNYTRQFGVEINLLLTKLFGEERRKFGFDSPSAPADLKHFALKIYGKVYEFGPYPEKVKKTLFLDWCAEHLAFEFATISTTVAADEVEEEQQQPHQLDDGSPTEKRSPIISYTMKFEKELDEWVEEFCERSPAAYHPIRNNCLKFIKEALLFLDPRPAIDCEMQRWLFKYQQKLAPDLQKFAQQLQSEETLSQLSASGSSSPATAATLTQMLASLRYSNSSTDGGGGGGFGAGAMEEEEIEVIDLSSDNEEA